MFSRLFSKKNSLNVTSRSSKELLEIDEVFFDHHQLNRENLRWENRLEKPISSKAVKSFWYILMAGLIFFLAESGYLSLVKGGYYSQKAKANYIREIWQNSPRGIIYDINLRPLVKNVSSFDLVVIPAELPKDRQSQEVFIKTLTQILNKSREEIIHQFEDVDRFSSRPVLILENLGHEEVLNLKSKIASLPGLRLEESFKRDYFRSPAFSHILGYTGRVSPSDIKRNPNYLLTDIIGKDGLEAVYDKVLRGERGVTLVESDALGSGRIISSADSRAGNSLVLFLDSRLQEKLTQALAEELSSLGLARGAAVAIDPRSGGILALQSFPVFDNNAFSSKLGPKEYAAIFEDKNKPLFDRAVSGLYPPGSTIKPFIGTAALMENIIDDKEQIFVTGSITVAGQEFKDWRPHGWVDIRRAIAVSSNVFFYTVGGGYGDISGLGPEKIHDYLARFGFGQLSQIDLTGEQKGFLPTPQWKRTQKNESWFIGDTYNISIGQGDILVTPLQMALATAAIANNGVLLKPRAVKQIVGDNGDVLVNIAPEIISKNFATGGSLKIIREGMREAVKTGSARSVGVALGVSAAGKTGTAQTGISSNTHAWFTVFAPYENPRIVLTVLVENGGEGSAAAVPIARKVLEWYFSGAADNQQ